MVVGHFSLCRKIDELCPYNGNKRVEQREGHVGWMLGFRGWKATSGTRKRKGTQRDGWCSGGGVHSYRGLY